MNSRQLWNIALILGTILLIYITPYWIVVMAILWIVIKISESNAGKKFTSKSDYSKGLELEKQKNPEKAKDYWRSAADKGHIESMYLYGLELVKEYQTAPFKDIISGRNAINYLTEAASKGNLKAQQQLGYLFENGIIVGRDRLQAAKWYSQSAIQGDANVRNWFENNKLSLNSIPSIDDEDTEILRMRSIFGTRLDSQLFATHIFNNYLSIEKLIEAVNALFDFGIFEIDPLTDNSINSKFRDYLLNELNLFSTSSLLYDETDPEFSNGNVEYLKGALLELHAKSNDILNMAVKNYRAAVKKNNTHAMVRLSVCCIKSIGVEHNPEKAQMLLEAAIKLGDVRAARIKERL